MKRVLILCDLFPPAFGPRMGYLCKYLKQAGWQVEVVAEAMDDKTFAFLAGSCPITFVPYYTAKNRILRKLQWIVTLLADFLFSYKDRKMAKVAHRICQRQAFDLILCSSFRTFPLVAARLTAQRHHCRWWWICGISSSNTPGTNSSPTLFMSVPGWTSS